MSSTRSRTLLAFVLVTALGGAAMAPGPSNAATPADRGDFRGKVLTSIAAISADDVWAAGYDFLAVHGGGHNVTLAEHWNGSTWRQSDTPNSGHGDNALLGIAAAGPGDVWAVGAYARGGETHPVVLHQDGASWSSVAVPEPDGCTTCGLSAVTALAPDDVWASGYGFTHPFFEHWDGTTWTLVAGPKTASPDYQSTLSGTSGSDLWMVATSVGGRYLALHWDGAAWTRVPVDGPRYGSFESVYAVAPDDVWAVGEVFREGFPHALIEHWDGSAWGVVRGSDLGDRSGLLGVSGTSARDVWAVGNVTEQGESHTLVEHWDGTTWSRVDSPTPTQDGLFAIDAISRSDAWTVGGPRAPSRAFSEHWDGTAWTIVKIP